jgi:hypothetical protein
MTSWPIESRAEVNPLTLSQGLEERLDFLLWVLTGHVRHHRPARAARNDLAPRAWAAPLITPRVSRGSR